MAAPTQQLDIKTFKHNFWNGEIGNFLGFEILVKRAKDGRGLCKEYIEFIRQRSVIEEQYGKALLKLAKSSWGTEEIGGVRCIWESLKNHTESVGLAHSKAVSHLESELATVSDFIESSRDKRRWKEENVRALQTQIKNAHKRMFDLRKLYESRCREEVQASHAYHQEVARGGEESGGSEKAAARHSKVRSSMESAETAYRGSVDYLEEVREQWINETAEAANTFQVLECGRLSLLRDSVWKLTNILSTSCVADDQVYEETRQVLEVVDLEDAIDQFITDNQTGTTKPGSQQPESLPNSSTMGMGHARQYDSCSLGRSRNFSSLGHLADTGRSRSDLGFTTQNPPARPRKPPRLHTYEPPPPTNIKFAHKLNNSNNNNTVPQHNSAELHKKGNRRTQSRDRHTMPICVENAEYYRLPGIQQGPQANPAQQKQQQLGQKGPFGLGQKGPHGPGQKEPLGPGQKTPLGNLQNAPPGPPSQGKQGPLHQGHIEVPPGQGNHQGPPGKVPHQGPPGHGQGHQGLQALPGVRQPGLNKPPPRPMDHQDYPELKPQSYSSDYSDTSLDSGKFSAASSPPTPSPRSV